MLQNDGSFERKILRRICTPTQVNGSRKYGTMKNSKNTGPGNVHACKD
jgi:hypothetical protein